MNNYQVQKMAKFESHYWWYKVLHEEVVNFLPKNKRIKILDIGCGTGGLLKKLKDNLYENCEGFDISPEAIKFCKKKNLNVFLYDMKLLKNIKDNYDILISLDNLYFLNKKEKEEFFISCKKILKSNGSMIINFPTNRLFSGIHDKAVGINERISLNQINKIIKRNDLQVMNYSYWPLFLSPIILFKRILQKVQFKIYKNQAGIDSDISHINPYLNKFLFNLCKFEKKFFRKISIFGSSCFVVIKKIK
jgi:SAM-dependent methyltransferase